MYIKSFKVLLKIMCSHNISIGDYGNFALKNNRCESYTDTNPPERVETQNHDTQCIPRYFFFIYIKCSYTTSHDKLISTNLLTYLIIELGALSDVVTIA